MRFSSLPEFNFPILNELQPRVAESLEGNSGHVFLNVRRHWDQGFQNRSQHPIYEQTLKGKLCNVLTVEHNRGSYLPVYVCT